MASLTPQALLSRLSSAISSELAYEDSADLSFTGSLATASLPQLERDGVAIQKLSFHSIRSGLYGRPIVCFERCDGSDLPASSIGVRQRVDLGASESGGRRIVVASGVVTEVLERSLSLTLDRNSEDFWDSVAQDEENFHFFILQRADRLQAKRLEGAMEKMKKLVEKESPLLKVAYEDGEPQFSHLSVSPEFSRVLNEGQRQAVWRAASTEDLHIIHGPPGCGKSECLVALVRELASRGDRILLCCAANLAVDQLVERLAVFESTDSGLSLVRVGHPARISPAVQSRSLASLVSENSSFEPALVKSLHEELNALREKIRQKKIRTERKTLKAEANSLAKEIRQREKTAVKATLDGRSVLLATCSSAASDDLVDSLARKPVDWLIIDEAAQCTEPAALIPLTEALAVNPRLRVVLAGDHRQLGATVKSPEATRLGLGISLFERLQATAQRRPIASLLCEQYRMNEAIMAWSNQQFYDGRLKANAAVAHHILQEIPGVEAIEETLTPFIFIDTAGCHMEESEGRGLSKENGHEVEIAFSEVKKLRSAGVPEAAIGLIAPYSAQVTALRARIRPNFPGIEIQTVDGFQGREKECIILSAVRSNQQRKVGFCAEPRRFNVALTRARRQLTIIGDSETLSGDSTLQALIAWAQQQEEKTMIYRGPDNFPQLEDMGNFSGQNIPQPEPQAVDKQKSHGAARLVEEKQKNKENNEKNSQKDDEKIAAASIEGQNDAAAEAEALRASEFSSLLSSLPFLFSRLSSGALKDFRLPQALTAAERKKIHEAAEQENQQREKGQAKIIHQAEQNGSNRQIVLRLAQPSLASPPNVRRAAEPQGELKKKEESEKPKQEKKVKQPKEKSSVEEPEDFDSIMAEFAPTATSARCATCAGRTGGEFSCQFCHLAFCTKHFNPILHGCARDARVLQRRALADSVHHKRPLKASDRDLLQARLDGAITKASQARQKKSNVKEKK